MKSAPSKSQMEKKRSGRGKRKSPELPPHKYGKTNQKAPPPPANAWKPSRLKEAGIQALVTAGLLQEKDAVLWNSAEGHAWPMEKNPDKVPMFATFVERGLALPSSDFFRGFLDFFKIEYVHLNPNSIFHIAVYIHFCEAFLGIRPHWALFRKIFRLKPQPRIDHTEVVDGAGVQVRQNAKEIYFDYELIDSNQDWKHKWFYIGNHPPQLTAPTGHRPIWDAIWNQEPSTEECMQVPELLRRTAAWKAQGLTAQRVAYGFMKRHVQPLMQRSHLGYEYTGEDDESRLSKDPISDDAILVQLSKIFKNIKQAVPTAVLEYSAERPPNPVSTHGYSPRALSNPGRY